MMQKRELEKAILGNIDRLVHILIDISHAASRRKAALTEQAIQIVRDLTPLLLNLLGGREEHLEGLLRQLILQKLPSGYALFSFGSLKQDLDQILALAFFKDSQASEAVNITEQPSESSAESEQDNFLIPVAEPEPAPDKGPLSEPKADKEALSEPEPDKDPSDESGADKKPSSMPEPENIPKPGFSVKQVAGTEPATIIISREAIPLDTEPPQEPYISSSALAPDAGPELPSPDAAAMPLLKILQRFFPTTEIYQGYYYRSLYLDYFLPEQKLAVKVLKPGSRVLPLLERLFKQEGFSLVKIQSSELNNPFSLIQKLKSI